MTKEGRNDAIIFLYCHYILCHFSNHTPTTIHNMPYHWVHTIGSQHFTMHYLRTAHPIIHAHQHELYFTYKTLPVPALLGHFLRVPFLANCTLLWTHVQGPRTGPVSAISELLTIIKEWLSLDRLTNWQTGRQTDCLNSLCICMSGVIHSISLYKKISLNLGSRVSNSWWLMHKFNVYTRSKIDQKLLPLPPDDATKLNFQSLS